MAEARSDRREAILAAATELWGMRGYPAVGMDDIGAAVGISGPAVYRHFAGKDVLLAEVMVTAARRIAVALGHGDPHAGEVPPAQLLRRSVSTVLDQPAGMAVFLEYGRLSGDLLAAVLEAHQQTGIAGLAMMDRLCPGVDGYTSFVRNAAIVGPVTAVALGWVPTTVARPRLDDLLSTAARAVLTCDPVERRPVPPRPAWRPAPTRRDEIVQVAMGLFAARGFSGVGTDEIGAAAGLAGPSLYRHFRAKSDIVAAAWQVFDARVRAGVHDAIAAADSAADALVRLARSYVSVALDSVDLVTLLMREPAAVQAADPGWADHVRYRQVAWVAVVRELRPDLRAAEAQLVADTVFPLVDAAVMPTMGAREWVDELTAMVVAHIGA